MRQSPAPRDIRRRLNRQTCSSRSPSPTGPRRGSSNKRLSIKKTKSEPSIVSIVPPSYRASSHSHFTPIAGDRFRESPRSSGGSPVLQMLAKLKIEDVPMSLLKSIRTENRRERKGPSRRPSPRLNIKGYDVGHTLGEGGFGKVKIAKRKAGGQNIVIKIMEKTGLDDLKRVDQVFGEMFILTSLRHKHVIQLYEVINHFNSILLVMEYAEGGELYNYVEKHTYLVETEAHRLFSQILDGLIYCHRRKVIHRDLKLENILLDKEGNIKIVDFGLSERLLGDAMLESVCGTPLYMSPELMRGEKYDGSTDVWSMGVVLYAMVCGFLPFSGKSLPELSAKVCGGFYTIPDFISSDLRNLIKGMLELEPSERLELESIQNHPWTMLNITASEEKAPVRLTLSQLAEIKAECYNSAAENVQRRRLQKRHSRNRSRTHEDALSQHMQKRYVIPSKKSPKHPSPTNRIPNHSPTTRMFHRRLSRKSPTQMRRYSMKSPVKLPSPHAMIGFGTQYNTAPHRPKPRALKRTPPSTKHFSKQPSSKKDND